MGLLDQPPEADPLKLVRHLVPVLAVNFAFGELHKMDAHQLDADGVILNTIVVDSLGVIPNLIDASIGGQIGDKIVSGGVVPKPAQMPTVAEYTVAVQTHLDTKAQEYHYDDIVSACSYAAAPNPFQAEGVAFVTWRGACWALCYSTMAEVKAGTRAQPTIAALLAAMPVLVL